MPTEPEVNFSKEKFAKFIFQLVSRFLLNVYRIWNYLVRHSASVLCELPSPLFKSSESREFQEHASLTVIVPVGNRLSHIQNTLQQNLEHFEGCPKVSFILSIFADLEGIAQWAAERFANQIANEKLVIVETESKEFNKAKAINETLRFVNSDFVLILDADIQISDSSDLFEGLKHLESGKFCGLSLGFWGVQILSIETLKDCGGFCTCLQEHDSNFTKGVYGDDFDLICRVLNRAADYNYKYLLYRKRDSIMIKTAWRGRLIKFSRKFDPGFRNGITHLNEVKAVDRPKGDYEKSLFFARIGRVLYQKELILLKYFYWQKYSSTCCFNQSRTEST